MYPDNVICVSGDSSLSQAFNVGDTLVGVYINAWNVEETGGGVDQVDARITDGGVEAGILTLPLWDTSEPTEQLAQYKQVTAQTFHYKRVMQQDEVLYFDVSGGQGSNISTQVCYLPVGQSTSPYDIFFGVIIALMISSAFISLFRMSEKKL